MERLALEASDLKKKERRRFKDDMTSPEAKRATRYSFVALNSACDCKYDAKSKRSWIQFLW